MSEYEYRLLGPGDTIEDGDEHLSTTSGIWRPIRMKNGAPVPSTGWYRRPIARAVGYEYRLLGPGDTIEDGDEYRDTVTDLWRPTLLESGTIIRSSELYRRPVALAAGAAPRSEIDGDSARKDDQEKLPLHLIPPEFLYAVAEILAFGAKKYAPRNWEKGINYSRVYRAAIGHLMSWFMRKGLDEETGKSHLWHAGCCIMFLICYELWGYDQFDDRPTRDPRSASKDHEAGAAATAEEDKQ